MGRSPLRSDLDPFGDEVAQAFVMTTQAQREEVVSQWRRGRDYYGPYVELLGISSMALLLASLLEAEDLSVCLPNGKPRRNHYGKLLDLLITCGKPVENSGMDVGKSAQPVEKTVDKSLGFCSEKTTFPHMGSFVGVYVDKSGSFQKLSTFYPQPER